MEVLEANFELLLETFDFFSVLGKKTLSLGSIFAHLLAGREVSNLLDRTKFRCEKD